MANIRPRKNKDGKITSYQIRVFKGKDIDGKELPPYIKTIKPYPDDWSAEKVQKVLNKEAVLFEKECQGGVVVNNKQTFEQYAKYVIELKENVKKRKHRTIKSYKEMLKQRINPAIGHLKLAQIKPQHLNSFYEQLSREGMNVKTGGYLSSKTILNHHRLINIVLKQATKELLIPYNAAALATPPEYTHEEADYLEIEDIQNILYYLEREPLKWQVAVYLLAFTGGRRGEVVGLKKDRIFVKDCLIKFETQLLYTKEKGIFEDKLKTEASKRGLIIPKKIMQQKIKLLLHELKENRLRLGTAWQDTGYLLTQDNGLPMHPDSLTSYCAEFREKYNKVIEKENEENPENKRKLLPRMNPHSFRHSQASILFFSGADPVTVSKRLGHAKVSTTTDIYSHILQKADAASSEALENIFLSDKNVAVGQKLDKS